MISQLDGKQITIRQQSIPVNTMLTMRMLLVRYSNPWTCLYSTLLFNVNT